MSEMRMRHLGVLVEKEQQAKFLALKIKDVRERLNLLTDPHRAIAHIDIGRMRMLLDDLTGAQEEFDRLIDEARLLREDLGLPRYEIR